MIQSVLKCLPAGLVAGSIPVLALAMTLAAAPALAEQGGIDLESGPVLEAIGTQELHGLMQEGTPLILVDARGPEVYTQERLPRAINIPADRVETLSSALPKEALIVVYCGGPKCPHSTVVARWLAERGWKRVRHYAEGISGWREAGHPLEGTRLPAGQGG